MIDLYRQPPVEKQLERLQHEYADMVRRIYCAENESYLHRWLDYLAFYVSEIDRLEEILDSQEEE